MSATSTPVESKPRCSDQHWISGFRVDEVAELLLPLAVGAGDSHDVAVIRAHQIGVLVNERLAHPGSVLLIDAEEDRLLKAVPAFLQELRDFPGYEPSPVIQDQRAVEVLGVVDTVLDLLSVPVQLALLRTVPLHVAVDMDLDDLVRGEEAVEDALFQGVGLDRLAKVMDVGNVFGFLGRGGQANLRGRRKIFKNLPPGCILSGTAAMAFVDHDQVEECWVRTVGKSSGDPPAR